MLLDTPCITASTETLFRQASMTVLLRKSYAKQHLELIAAYMQTAAIDFGAAVIARAIESVSTALDNIEKGA